MKEWEKVKEWEREWTLGNIIVGHVHLDPLCPSFLGYAP